MSDIRKMIMEKRTPSFKKDEAEDVMVDRLIEMADHYYDKLYEDEKLDDVVGYLGVLIYEKNISGNEERMDIVRKMVAKRGDFYASDREVASLAFAFLERGLIHFY